MLIKKLNLFVALLSLCCAVGTNLPCYGQVLNGEFDGQSDDNLFWWYGSGNCDVERISKPAPGSGYAALVSGRTFYWEGIGQDLHIDDVLRLDVGTDYHFQCWVRTKDVSSGVLRIEISQEDDRETEDPDNDNRYLAIAKVMANDQEWTLLEGGFHFLANGPIKDLRFTISGDYTDDRTFDFYVDAVTITKNDWSDAATQRIEQFRKRDVVLKFEDVDGNAVSDVAVDIEQVGHRFAFGSTLNAGFIENETYRNFFKENFEWATIEWFAQWFPVEEVQGVEDYTRADATVEFAEANGIKLRGHSLAWPDERFVPTWLKGQSEGVHRNELNERIDNVVSRYAGRLVHWDVINEMLNYTYYQDILGSDIRSDVFKRARDNDPDVKLFTNEFGLTNSGIKATRYRELIQGLQSAGADVGGIGLQSHFDSNVSPKAMELTLAKLTDLGPEIWFTEFDVSNIDEGERAKLLETFYRYAFSVPEAKGIIMWGFWPEFHWRGENSSILNSDFSLNAAGRKYFDLIEGWTTNLTANGSTNQSQLAFRGFHGTYKITTTDSDGVVSEHLVTIEPGNGAQDVRLTLSPNAEGFLTIYGTAGDDIIEFDFAHPNTVLVNEDSIVIPNSVSSELIQIAGLGGDDTLNINGAEVRQNYVAGVTGVKNSSTQQTILCDGVETVNFTAGTPTDRIVIVGTAGQDLFYSTPDITSCQFDERIISLIDFENLLCRSIGGNDLLAIADSEEFDYVTSDFRDFLSVRSGANSRRFYNFSNLLLESSDGKDFLVGTLSDTATAVSATFERIASSSSVSSFEFTNFLQTNITSDFISDHSLVADIGGNQSKDRIFSLYETTTMNEVRSLRHQFNGFTNVQLLGDNLDRLFLSDSPFNDTLITNTNRVEMSGGGRFVSGENFRTVFAKAFNGGVNIADERATNYLFTLLGDWTVE